MLAEAGIVKNSRDGRENLWQLRPKSLTEARRLLDGISREWDDTLERLRAYVKRDD